LMKPISQGSTVRIGDYSKKRKKRNTPVIEKYAGGREKSLPLKMGNKEREELRYAGLRIFKKKEETRKHLRKAG